VFTLPIRTADVIALCSLAEVRKDPFDRILVAQSLSEGLPLVTKDEHLALSIYPNKSEYNVQLLPRSEEDFRECRRLHSEWRNAVGA
jgi:hypothetical protein